MMKRTAFLAGTAALSACGGGSSGGGTVTGGTVPPAGIGPSSTILTNMSVVSTTDGSVAPNQTIVMSGGKITSIGPPLTGNVLALGTVVASGGYVVPGFNDYHAHPFNYSDPQGALSLMLAYGITGFRQMAGSAALLAQRAAGSLTTAAQPALLEMPGDILTVANATSPAAAIAIVDQQQAAGADFIKVVGINPPVFEAVQTECNARGIRMIGHLQATVDPRAAAAAGMKSIEHLGPQDAFLLGCSSEEAAIRAAIAPGPPGGPFATDPNFVTDQITLPTLFTSAATFARFQQVINTYSTTQMQDLASKLVAAGTWTVPTLIRLRTMANALDPSYSADPNLKYVPQATIASWTALAAQFKQYINAQQQSILSQMFTLQMGLVRPFKSAGVPMMTGSDLGGEWVIPGVGLHQEFDMLAAAGLTPLEVLQMTTLNGAQFLGRTSTMGTVAVGKNADLVILSADPTQSVANLHAISGVVRGGVYSPPATINTLKASVAKRMVSFVPAPGSHACTCCSIYA